MSVYQSASPLLQWLSVYLVSSFHLWPFTLPALWWRWQWLFVRSFDHFFQTVVFEVLLFIITKINKCTEYCRIFVPRENLTWCHLVFCEHPISLKATNDFFGGTLTPVLTGTQIEICKEATRPLREHIMWTENYNIMMESWRAWTCFGIRKQ